MPGLKINYSLKEKGISVLTAIVIRKRRSFLTELLPCATAGQKSPSNKNSSSSKRKRRKRNKTIGYHKKTGIWKLQMPVFYGLLNLAIFIFVFPRWPFQFVLKFHLCQ